MVFILISITRLCQAENGSQLIKQGFVFYEVERIDSSTYCFQQALANSNPEIKLLALAGLTKIATLQTELKKADSLIIAGNDLIKKKATINQEAICIFDLSKGEYFRKNSQFDKALSTHQNTLKKVEKLDLTNLVWNDCIQAEALQNIGLTYERLTQYDSCVIYIDKCYEAFREILDSNDVKFASIYNNMGTCYYRANKKEQSKSYYLKAIKIAEEKMDPLSTSLSMSLGNIASISRIEEKYNEAIQYTERALNISKQKEDKNGMAFSYYGLGIYHYFLGDYGRTKDYMEACIAIREKIYNKNHFRLIGPYQVLGIALEESGDYEKTLYYNTKSREIIKANFGKSSLEEAFSLENTAICFNILGQTDSAFHYIKKANEILTNKMDKNDPAMAVHYLTQSNIARSQKDYKGAVEFMEKSNEILKLNQLEQSNDYALNQAALGMIYTDANNYQKANDCFEDALDIISSDEEKFGFKFSPNSFKILDNYLSFLFMKYNKGKDKNDLDLFEKYTQIYLDLSDDFRNLFNDPYTKSIVVKNNYDVYNRIIGQYHYLYQQANNPDYLKACFNFSEYGRTTMLRDLQNEKIQAYSGLPDSIYQKELSLRKKITKLNQALTENPDSASLKKAIFESKERFNKLVEQSAKKHPKYFELRFDSKIIEIDEIKAKIKEGENFIEIMQDDSTYLALLINRKNTSLLKLGSKEEIDKMILDWKESISARNPANLDEISKKLYDKVWNKLEKQIDGKRLIIIPSGAFYYLNFECLYKEADKNYLIYDYNISYDLSLNIHFSKENKEESTSSKSRPTTLGIAPGFEDEIKEAYVQKLSNANLIDQSFLKTIRQPWSVKLANKLEEKKPNKILTGLEATESQVKANLPSGKILYFGTHAIANAQDPLHSKLLLAKEIGPQNEDGYLHAYELYEIDLNAELAVLNACESGLGKLQEGEGMISLAYGMKYAGCPSTVMSLWKVDEKISSNITEQFLDILHSGANKSEALRTAKLDYLNSADKALQSPFYWGGLILMGKDGPVADPPSSIVWLVFLGLLVFVGLFFLRQRRKRW